MNNPSLLQGQAVYVVDGMRTPFLKARGTPGPFSASDLALAAARATLLRQPPQPSALDEVVWGCVSPAPDEVNIARIVALRMGCGERVGAHTVQRNCGSGMQALDTAARHIAAGQAQLVLAGGSEAMSRSPVLLATQLVAWLARWRAARSLPMRARALAALRPAHLRPVIGLLQGLTDPVVGLSMGQTAEVLAERFGIEREAMDAYALESHRRLAQAVDEEALEQELALLVDADGKVHVEDDGLRRSSDEVRLGKLKPVFDRPWGRVTAGNSAQVSDGAAALLLAGEDAVRHWHLNPLGRIVDLHWAGLDPSQMGLGPVHAATPLLARHGLDPEAVGLWEINEAFAAQVLACLAAWGDGDYCRTELGLDGPWGSIDPQRLNVDGGAIALGHPVGASGARIVLHLFYLLQRRELKRGVAALCIGGGQGGAMLLER
jgi:acetyl-CoA C-acetyltransferase